MLEAGILHSLLLFFFKMFNYILVFFPKTEEDTTDNSSVMGTKRKLFLPAGFSSGTNS